MYWLVQFKVCWDDECDFYGFHIFSQNEYDHWQMDLNRLPESFDLWMGTNQCVEINKDEFLDDCLIICGLTEESALDMIDAFGGKKFGNFPNIKRIIDECV